MAFVETGLAWLAAKRKEKNSRAVTYRRPSTGAEIEIDAAVGQTQSVNLNNLGVGPDFLDTSALSAEAMNRDYIVDYADLVSVWPPQSGDLIDDENDEDGIVNRYQVMALPGQDVWRWFRGGYQKSARVHTKFLTEYAPLWLDGFTGTNGTLLDAHLSDLPSDGAYVGGTGGIEIQSNRIVATDATAYRFFPVGESDVIASVDWCANCGASDLAGVYAEMGIGVRCAGSGSGQRDGYYCLFRVGYTAGSQTTRTLSIVSRVGGVNTTVATVTAPVISLKATYRLQAECVGSRLVLSLLDSLGEVSIASTDYDAAAMASQQSCAVMFSHHASIVDPSLSYLDSLAVENG